MSRPVVLEHLTLLDYSAPDLVAIAADAGYDEVGIRLVPPARDFDFPSIVGDAPALRETCVRLTDLGVRVRDIETVAIDADFNAAMLEAALQSGAELGARVITATAEDADRQRLTDSFARLAELAARYGLDTALEPMRFKSVRTVAEALHIASSHPRGRVLVDTLHFCRAGEAPGALRAVSADTLAYVQIADAPAAPADVAALTACLPGRWSGVDPLRVEANVGRALPGEGDLDLPALVGLVDAHVPLAVEIPALQRRRELGDLEFVRRARQATGAIPHPPRGQAQD